MFNNTNKSILLTGTAGFIGSNFVPYFLDKYQEYNLINLAISKWYYRWFCDLSKTDNIKEAKEYMVKALPTSFYKPRYIKSVLRYLWKVKKN